MAKKNRKHFCRSAAEQKEGLSDAPMSAGRVVKQEYAHGSLTHFCNAKQDIRSTRFINRVGRRYSPFTSGYTWARHRENLLTVSSSMVTRMGLQLATRLPDSESSSLFKPTGDDEFFSTQCLRKNLKKRTRFFGCLFCFCPSIVWKTIICNHLLWFRYCR